MGELLLLDTSVLIATERGQLSPDALSKVQPGARLSVSVITVSELLHGVHRAKTRWQRQSRQRFLTALLAELEILSFDLSVAREHARIWAELAERGENIGPYDLIIAASALSHGAALATLNYREFRKVKGLRVPRFSGLKPSEGRKR